MKKIKTPKALHPSAMVSPRKLKAHPKNIKLFGHNDTNYEALINSIRKNGFLAHHSILCYQEGKNLVVVSGHRRVRAAIELSIEGIPVTVMPKISDAEIERLIIEENLMRPNEGRKLSYVERYILALRLAQNFPEQRGGDRRSEEFRTNFESRQGKNEWLSAVTGICLKYLSELDVITKRICQDLEKSYPELLGLRDNEQLQIILIKGLSKDLNDLHLGHTSIRKFYNKYKLSRNPSTKGNKTSPSENPINTQSSEIDNSSARPPKNSELALVEQQSNISVAFLQRFKDFLVEHFVGHPSFEKALLIMSEPMPQSPIASLQMLRKAANLLLKNNEKPVTETIKVGDIQSLLPFAQGNP